MNAVSSKLASRRRVLRGAMAGGAVTFGLPYLDCFLNANGTAEAATGKELPACFGTWFQGLGLNPGFWEPRVTGGDHDMAAQLEPLRAFKKKMNIFSGMRVFMDAHPPMVHAAGVYLAGGGVADPGTAFPSVDTLISDHIGGGTRFRSLEVAYNGTRDSISKRSASAINPSEGSLLALYTKIFGPDFQDPNAADFKPDPKIMVRKSVLSAFSDQRQALMRDLGASDRARLDEYFTATRELEASLALQLEKPAPLPACSVPTAPTSNPDGAKTSDNPLNGVSQIAEEAVATSKLYSRLVAHAVACGQTRVANMLFCSAVCSLRQAASPVTFHIFTHEEQVDPKLGYQLHVAWFQEQCMFALRDMLAEFDSIKEGDHTLLDRIVIMFASDTGHAKFHSVENMPMMTFGGARGRIKTGLHVSCAGDTVNRVGLTLQQALGLPVDAWGTESNRTNKTISEILA